MFWDTKNLQIVLDAQGKVLHCLLLFPETVSAGEKLDSYVLQKFQSKNAHDGVH